MKLFVCLFAVLLASCSASPQARIVGGYEADPGQVPYQASLKIAGLPTCGAVILGNRYALTALRCVANPGSNPWPPQMFTVGVGSVDLYTGRTDFRVEEIIVNPNYNSFEVGIVLLKLVDTIVFSKFIQSIPLSDVTPPVGTVVETSGWGRTNDNEEDMQRTLRINEGTVLEERTCGRLLARNMNSQEICVGFTRRNGMCRGDFGGPAVYNGKLVGIAAYVVGECGSELPDVFTSISANYDWIVEKMSP